MLMAVQPEASLVEEASVAKALKLPIDFDPQLASVKAAKQASSDDLAVEGREFPILSEQAWHFRWIGKWRGIDDRQVETERKTNSSRLFGGVIECLACNQDRGSPDGAGLEGAED